MLFYSALSTYSNAINKKNVSLRTNCLIKDDTFIVNSSNFGYKEGSLKHDVPIHYDKTNQTRFQQVNSIYFGGTEETNWLAN